ncbi:xylulose kinase [Thermotoga sp. Ku-13t]|uniref:xylulokinase n=1 Tax=Thermotoga sp. Ku-13t TaxID=1755813 RepID=UPI0013ED8D56|nr:xylulokinase [Thermotoga sp. Ku-13t]KAF2958569.1 xylulose kinase [Thermotoga sp. Ku-13t]
MELFVGLDLGTTGVKGLLVNTEGKILAIHGEKLSLSTPKPAWAEQNPHDWWNAVVKVLKGLSSEASRIGGTIRAIATSGQMHSLVIIDRENRVLRDAILWCDQRTYAECEEATNLLGGEEQVLKMVGNPILTGFTLPKLLWLRKNEPEVYEKIHKMMLPKDFINFMLTDNVTTEHSDASGTTMYDVSRMRWNDDVLSALKIKKEILPEILPSNGIVGKVKREIAEELNLKDAVVVAGGADNACAALGVGVIKPGDVMVSLGTSGTVVAPTQTGSFDPKGRVHFFAHTVPNVRYHMGVMLTATYSLEWFKERFLNENYDEINEQVTQVPIGSNGIVFLPYLNGERTPHRDPHARGVFFGLSSFHSKWDVVRAIFEGVAFGIRDSFEILKELGLNPKHVRIAGGGSKSRVWNQMIADALNVEIEKPFVDEGASYGAAMLACSGYFNLDVRKISREWFKLKELTRPDRKNGEKYEEFYERFRKLYSTLKDMFREGQN